MDNIVIVLPDPDPEKILADTRKILHGVTDHAFNKTPSDQFDASGVTFKGTKAYHALEGVCIELATMKAQFKILQDYVLQQGLNK